MSDEPKKMKVGYHPNSQKNRFKKGETHNPEGSRAHQKEFIAARNLTKLELAEVANLIINSTMSQLEALAANPKATVLQRMTMALAKRCIEKGDTQAFDALMNRLVGKVTDKIEVTGNSLPQVQIYLPDNNRDSKQVDNESVELLPENSDDNE